MKDEGRRGPRPERLLLLACLAAVLWSPPRAAGADRPPPVLLDELVVRAERDEPEPREPSLAGVDRGEIENALTETVAGSLEGVNGIFRFRNARGDQGIVLRGFDQRQVLVLLDGVPLYNAYDRVLDLGRIPLGPVDHVTVVKGAGSVAYGPNGLGGAINITTRRPGDGPLLEAEGAASPEDASYLFRMGSDLSFRPFSSHLDFGIAGEGGYHLSDRFDPARNENGGRRENSDAEHLHLGGKIAWDPSPGQRLQVGGYFFRGEWGVPPEAYTERPRYWRWSLWKDLSLHVDHAGRYGRFSMEEQAYANLNTTELDSYDDASYTSQTGRRAFHSRQEDATFGATLRPSLSMHLLAPGRGAWVRAWLGARYDRHEERPAPGGPKRTFSVYTLTLAPEIEIHPHPRLSLIAGLQADLELPGRVEGFDPDETFHVGPRVQARYHPGQAFFVSLQANRRARFPTLKERYSSTVTGRVPNPSLQPEKAWNVGLDAGYEKERFRLTAGLFFSDVSDLIEETLLPSGDRRIDNQGKVRYTGAEASVDWIPLEGLRLQARYAFLHWHRMDAPDDHLPRRPAHTGTAALSYQGGDRWSVSTTLRAVSGRDAQDPDTGSWGRLDPYVLWDLLLLVRPLEKVSLWFRVENLLDTDYETEYGFPEPGRTFWVGIKTHIRKGAGSR